MRGQGGHANLVLADAFDALFFIERITKTMPTRGAQRRFESLAIRAQRASRAGTLEQLLEHRGGVVPMSTLLPVREAPRYPPRGIDNDVPWLPPRRTYDADTHTEFVVGSKAIQRKIMDESEETK